MSRQKPLILTQANKTIEFSSPDKKGYVIVEVDNGEGPNDILLSNEQLTQLTMWLHEYGLNMQKQADE